MENSKKQSNKINLSTKVYAAVMVVLNAINFSGYLAIYRDPEAFRQNVANLPVKMTEADIQRALATVPFEMALLGAVMLGLILIILNQKWGFFIYAAIPLYRLVIAVKDGVLVADALMALLPVVVLGLLLWFRPFKTSDREKIRMIREAREEHQQENAAEVSQDQAESQNAPAETIRTMEDQEDETIETQTRESKNPAPPNLKN